MLFRFADRFGDWGVKQFSLLPIGTTFTSSLELHSLRFTFNFAQVLATKILCKTCTHQAMLHMPSHIPSFLQTTASLGG